MGHLKLDENMSLWQTSFFVGSSLIRVILHSGKYAISFCRIVRC